MMARHPTRSLWLGRALDAVAYVVAVTGVFVVTAAVPSFAAGLGWLGVKWVLFLVGWLAFGYATFSLRPRPPWKGDDGPSSRTGRVLGGRTETRFQAAVQALPPARFHRLPVDDRLPTGVNVFLASLAMLATSFGMEVVFGV